MKLAQTTTLSLVALQSAQGHPSAHLRLTLRGLRVHSCPATMPERTNTPTNQSRIEACEGRPTGCPSSCEQSALQRTTSSGPVNVGFGRLTRVLKGSNTGRIR